MNYRALLPYGVLICIFFCCAACSHNSTEATTVATTTSLIPEIKGADVSFLPEVRESGVTLYNTQRQPEDMLVTLKKAGVNTLRWRLWKSPSSSTSSLLTVQKMVQEAKRMGFAILISLHYSDEWADPAKQTKPKDWQTLTPTQLGDSVYAYTQTVVKTLQPDYLQIGNEINHGFLWEEGKYDNITQFKGLLGKGIAAVRANSPTTKIVLHYAGIDNILYFFQSVKELDYDMIGVSYYPLWHGKDFGMLKNTLMTLATQNNKPIFIAETSYPFTLEWNDWTNNVIGLPSQLLSNYAATPQGQKEYLVAIRDLVRGIPQGKGFCYWGGEWISYRGAKATDGSTWENQALWDFSNQALPALDAYQ